MRKKSIVLLGNYINKKRKIDMNKNPIAIFKESRKFNIFFKYTFPIVSLAVLMLFIVAILLVRFGKLNIDQDVNTILSTTAGVTGSMFGLTAASYAFIWTDLRSDKMNNRHLGYVINKYRDMLWLMFLISLVLTVIVILTGFVFMGMEQIWSVNWGLITKEQSNQFVSHSYYTRSIKLSIFTLINLLFSILAVILMVSMNYYIFRRDNVYSDISKSIINEINKKYSKIDDKFIKEENKTNDLEYKKIHNLELIIERILDNHESVGSAFTKSNRRTKLLLLEIERIYNKNYKNIGEFGWEYLSNNKRENKYKLSKEHIERERDFNSSELQKTKSSVKATENAFVSVYDDLIKTRDSYLIYEERRQKHSTKKNSTFQYYRRPELRYTAKKRLLFFFMRGEEFTNMDLSGVSLSGADLQYTNFSGCNLSNIKLKGSNCEGADFTNTKMVGMYFFDSIDNSKDANREIPITYIDDNAKIWDPYKSHESTYFKFATFKGADISRACLNANITYNDDSFPYWENENENLNKYTDMPLFSFEGANFDDAKMFNSLFSFVNFDKSSLEKSQMYNAIVVMSSAQSSNFSNAVLTNSIIVSSDFNNSNAAGTVFADSMIAKNRFANANLRNANFTNSNLVGNNFEHASCQYACFKNISQSKENFIGITSVEKFLYKKYQTKNSFRFATLTKTDFTSSDLSSVDFSCAVGNECIFTKSNGVKTIFDSALFISSVLNHAMFEESRFNKTVLRNSVLMNTQFKNCTFENTDFSESIFNTKESCFIGGVMKGVKFDNVVGLSSDSFKGIKLINMDFSSLGFNKKDFDDSVTLIDCKF